MGNSLEIFNKTKTHQRDMRVTINGTEVAGVIDITVSIGGRVNMSFDADRVIIVREEVPATPKPLPMPGVPGPVPARGATP